MPWRSHDTATLNNLIATTFDSVDGYAEAGKNSHSDRHIALFKARMVERKAVISTLRGEVIRLGGKPDEDGTVLGGVQRVFLNLKSVVTSRDEAAIVTEVAQGEDHLKAKFAFAIADAELSPTVMRLIRECYTLIKQGHEQMRDLKPAAE